MKIFRNILYIFTLVGLLAVPASAQNKQIKENTILKNYTIEHENGSAEYQLKIHGKATESVKLETTERNMTNQSREESPIKVTKIVSIDANMDNTFEGVLQISYMSNIDENFKIYPSKRGFVINVVGKELNYDLLKNEYSVKKGEADFFDVITWDETK